MIHFLTGHCNCPSGIGARIFVTSTVSQYLHTNEPTLPVTYVFNPLVTEARNLLPLSSAQIQLTFVFHCASCGKYKTY